MSNIFSLFPFTVRSNASKPSYNDGSDSIKTYLWPYGVGQFFVSPLDTIVAMRSREQCIFNLTPIRSIIHPAGFASGSKYAVTCAIKEAASKQCDNPIVNGAIVGISNHIMSMVTDVLIKQAADQTRTNSFSIRTNSCMRPARISFLSRDIWLFCWVLNSNHFMDQYDKNYEAELRGISVFLGGVTSSIPHIVGVSFMNNLKKEEIFSNIKNMRFLLPILGIRIVRTGLIDYLMT